MTVQFLNLPQQLLVGEICVVSTPFISSNDKDKAQELP